MLQSFLWRFAHFSHTARGLDDSVEIASLEESETAAEALDNWGTFTTEDGEEERSSRDIFKIRLPGASNSPSRFVYGWIPIHQSAFPVCCGFPLWSALLIS